MKKNFLLAIGVTVVLSLLLLFYALFVEPTHPKVEHITIRSPKFGPHFKGLEIVQISDLHLKRLTDFHSKVAAEINALHPDYIFITGDFFSSRDALGMDNPQELELELEDISAFLKMLKPAKGVYVVRGNNDFTIYKERSNLFPLRLEREGIPCLTNQRRILEIDGERILLAGVDFSEFDPEDVANFYISKQADYSVIKADSSDNNSYSHFFRGNSKADWRNYTFSGRMKKSSTRGFVGVTFYSHLDEGLDRFYRLRQSSVYPAFYLSPHTTTLGGDSLSTNVVPQPNVWYSFKIKVTTLEEGTHILAKVWPSSEAEPGDWQAEATDRTASAIDDGTIGLWSAKTGERRFDDLLVVTDRGDTLLNETFESYNDRSDPYGWVDFDRDFEAIPMLKEGLPDSLFSVLLSHSPDNAPAAAKSGFDLVLSGHTHGGQVRLPFIGAPLVHIKLGQRFVNGLNQLDKTLVYTTRGIGTVWLPVRFLSPPEITHIRLRR